MQHIELAEKLGIKKQNINLWIKKKQNIPKKYLPILEETFGIKKEYFNKEIDEIDKLEIQKEKLSGMFIQSEKFVEEHQGRIDNLSIYGQELNATTWKLCKMNLAIRGLDGNMEYHQQVTPIMHGFSI
jgi:transcriptional regulator with XRE-family HTH domain